LHTERVAPSVGSRSGGTSHQREFAVLDAGYVFRGSDREVAMKWQ
jgi:hypothetical protein